MFNIFNSNSLKRLHSNYSESMNKLNITTKKMDLVVTKIVLRKDYLQLHGHFGITFLRPLPYTIKYTSPFVFLGYLAMPALCSICWYLPSHFLSIVSIECKLQ